MPIATDATRLSIDFTYEYETPSGEVLHYVMKYHHSEAGPTVQLANGPYEPIELPAQMFTEVAEFLISQGVLRGAKPPIAGRPDVGSGGLALPTIHKRSGQSRPPGVPAEPVEAISMMTPEEMAESEAQKAKNLAMAEERRIAAARAAKSGKKIKSDHRAD